MYDDFSQDFIQQLKFNVKRIVGIFQTLNGNLADLIQTETKASLEKRFRNWADLVFDDNVEAALTGFFGHFKGNIFFCVQLHILLIFIVPNFLPVTRNLVEKVQISVNNFLSKEIEVHDILLFSSESCRDQASCIYAGNAISRLSIENVYFTVQTLSSCHNRNVRKAIKFSLGSFLGISSDDEAINEYTRFRGQGSKASHTNCLQKRCLNLFFESSGPQRQAFVSNLIHLDQLAFLVIYNFHQENGLEEFKKLSAKVTKFIQALRLLLPTSKSDFWIPKNDLFYYYIYDEINEREFRSIPSTLLRIGNGSYKDIISRYIWRLSSSRNDQISDKIKLKNGSWIIFYKTSARYTILYRTYDNLRKAHKTTDISSYESINDIGRIARQFIHRTRIQDHRAWDIW